MKILQVMKCQRCSGKFCSINQKTQKFCTLFYRVSTDFGKTLSNFYRIAPKILQSFTKDQFSTNIGTNSSLQSIVQYFSSPGYSISTKRKLADVKYDPRYFLESSNAFSKSWRQTLEIFFEIIKHVIIITLKDFKKLQNISIIFLTS